jgi:hypothetical protein
LYSVGNAQTIAISKSFRLAGGEAIEATRIKAALEARESQKRQFMARLRKQSLDRHEENGQKWTTRFAATVVMTTWQSVSHFT